MSLSRLLPLSLTLGLLAAGCDDGKAADAKGATKAEAKAEPAKEAKDAKKEDAKAEAAPAAKAEEKPEADGAGNGAPAAADGEPPAAEAAGDAPAAADDAPAAADTKADADKPADAPKADKPKPKSDKPKPKADKPKEEPKPEPAAAAGNGKELYMKKCKNCHGATGAADTKIAKKHDIASWKESGWKSKWTLSKVKDIVANGKSGTKMKAFKGKLSPEEIAAVSAYARGLGK